MASMSTNDRPTNAPILWIPDELPARKADQARYLLLCKPVPDASLRARIDRERGAPDPVATFWRRHVPGWRRSLSERRAAVLDRLLADHHERVMTCLAHANVRHRFAYVQEGERPS